VPKSGEILPPKNPEIVVPTESLSGASATQKSTAGPTTLAPPVPLHPTPLDKEDSDKMVCQALYQMEKVLKGLSSKQKAKALTMLGSTLNLKVSSSFAPQVAMQPAVKQLKAKVSRPAVSPPSRGNPSTKAPKDIKEVKSKISVLNKEISQASKKLGEKLPTGHDLLQRRDQLFRDLKGQEITERGSVPETRSVRSGSPTETQERAQ